MVLPHSAKRMPMVPSPYFRAMAFVQHERFEFAGSSAHSRGIPCRPTLLHHEGHGYRMDQVAGSAWVIVRL